MWFNISPVQISIDIESYDPNLKTLGPGGVRGDGTLIGTAFYTENGVSSWYTKEGLASGILDNWFDAVDTVIGANILYDLEWIRATYGFTPTCKIIDIQLAERILNPNAKSVKLGALAEKYLGEVKQFDEIQNWWDTLVLPYNKKAGKAIENMDKIPLALVEKYAKDDARQTYLIWQKQEALLNEDKNKGLLSAFERESKLLKIFLDMRFTGIPFSEGMSITIENKIHSQVEYLNKHITGYFNAEVVDKKKKVNKATIAGYCESVGIDVTKTPTGQIKLQNEWMLQQNNLVLNDLVRRDVITKLMKDYVIGIRKFEHSGKIYGSYHPFRSDENGTVTGRLSATKPNLQQIPKRDEQYGDLIRSQFKAPEGHVWIKADFSQQEPRCFVHYACHYEIEQAFDIRNMYIQNPHVDFYTVLVNLCHQHGYEFITRSHAKMLLLATMYGMGKKKLALKMSISVEEADKLSTSFHTVLPFIKEMQHRCSAQVNDKYYIETIGKRKVWFDDYQKRLKYEEKKKLFEIDPKHDDLRTWKYQALKAKCSDLEIRKDYEIAYSYKSLNFLIQGSCADLTKQAMINCYNAGYTPVSQVHDELNFIVPEADVHIATGEIQSLMENTFNLKVPMIVDIEVGDSWGTVKHYDTGRQIMALAEVAAG